MAGAVAVVAGMALDCKYPRLEDLGVGPVGRTGGRLLRAGMPIIYRHDRGMMGAAVQDLPHVIMAVAAAGRVL